MNMTINSIFTATVAIAATTFSVCMIPMQSALADAEHVTKVAKSNNEATIRGYARWDHDCNAEDPPQVYLHVAPKDGVVCARASTVTVKTIREGTALHCLGRSIPGINVVYLPRFGFSGADAIRYTVKFKAVSLTVDADIQVQSDQVCTESGAAQPSSPAPQTEGPIPVCAALVS
jgi:hypothetical protein